MRRKINRHEKAKHQARRLRERMRVVHVINGIGVDLTVKDIHFATGLSEKNIRKIMLENPSEITFTLLAKQAKEEKK